jgi:hypothetical protein
MALSFNELMGRSVVEPASSASSSFAALLPAQSVADHWTVFKEVPARKQSSSSIAYTTLSTEHRDRVTAKLHIHKPMQKSTRCRIETKSMRRVLFQSARKSCALDVERTFDTRSARTKKSKAALVRDMLVHSGRRAESELLPTPANIKLVCHSFKVAQASGCCKTALSYMRAWLDDAIQAGFEPTSMTESLMVTCSSILMRDVGPIRRAPELPLNVFASQEGLDLNVEDCQMLVGIGWLAGRLR